MSSKKPNPSRETVPLIAGTYFAICPALRSRTLDQTPSACQIRTMTPMQASWFFLKKASLLSNFSKSFPIFWTTVLLVQKLPYFADLASSVYKNLLSLFAKYLPYFWTTVLLVQKLPYFIVPAFPFCKNACYIFDNLFYFFRSFLTLRILLSLFAKYLLYFWTTVFLFRSLLTIMFLLSFLQNTCHILHNLFLLIGGFLI